LHSSEWISTDPLSVLTVGDINASSLNERCAPVEKVRTFGVIV